MSGARRGTGASSCRRSSGSVLAYAQRADGSMQVFAPSGREMHNNQGGASALLQRLTDAAGAPSGWRLTTADMDVETYDAAGRLLAVALRNGRSYALTYANGRLATVADTFGGRVTFTYDASGRLGGFVAPGDRAYVYGYDAAGRLTSVTYPDNAVRTYHYEDPNFVHALTGITDENGARFATWSYEGTGRATSSQHAGGVDSVTLYYGSYSPTANDGRTLVVDGFGTTRTYNYQVAGGVVRIRIVSDPAGTSISTFDANGNIGDLSRRERNADELRVRPRAKPRNLAHRSLRHSAGAHDHDAVASRLSTCRRGSSRHPALPGSARSPTMSTTRRATCCRRRSPPAPRRGNGR